MLRIFILIILLFNLSFSKCIGWVGKAPNKAYCWDIEKIEQDNENLKIMVDVYGYPQTSPTVTLDNRYAKFISKKDIPN